LGPGLSEIFCSELGALMGLNPARQPSPQCTFLAVGMFNFLVLASRTSLPSILLASRVFSRREESRSTVHCELEQYHERQISRRVEWEVFVEEDALIDFEAITSLDRCISLITHYIEPKPCRTWLQNRYSSLTLVQKVNDIGATDHKEGQSYLHIPSPKATASDC